MREKLIELLIMADDYEERVCLGHSCITCPYKGTDCTYKAQADHLIANGVAVQKEAKLYWKPVKPGEWNLTCSACDSHLGCKENSNFCPECGAKFVYPKAVAPQPPKGE